MLYQDFGQESRLPEPIFKQWCYEQNAYVNLLTTCPRLLIIQHANIF